MKTWSYTGWHTSILNQRSKCLLSCLIQWVDSTIHMEFCTVINLNSKWLKQILNPTSESIFCDHSPKFLSNKGITTVLNAHTQKICDCKMAWYTTPQLPCKLSGHWDVIMLMIMLASFTVMRKFHWNDFFWKSLNSWPHRKLGKT